MVVPVDRSKFEQAERFSPDDIRAQDWNPEDVLDLEVSGVPSEIWPEPTPSYREKSERHQLPGVLMGLIAGALIGGGLVAVLGSKVWPRAFTDVPNNPGLSTTVQGQSGGSTVSSGINVSTTDATTGLASNEIMVDVKGDVKHPGVVQVAGTARVLDAIRAAGGVLHQQDNALLNLAAPVNDGDEVIVPDATTAAGSALRPSSSSPLSPSASSASVPLTSGTVATSRTVDLNTADVQTLETIPGIGPAKAAAIVSYRMQHGPFVRVQDVTKVPGIGPTTLQHIESFVTVGHP